MASKSRKKRSLILALSNLRELLSKLSLSTESRTFIHALISQPPNEWAWDKHNVILAWPDYDEVHNAVGLSNENQNKAIEQLRTAGIIKLISRPVALTYTNQIRQTATRRIVIDHIALEKLAKPTPAPKRESRRQALDRIAEGLKKFGDEMHALTAMNGNHDPLWHAGTIVLAVSEQLGLVR